MKKAVVIMMVILFSGSAFASTCKNAFKGSLFGAPVASSSSSGTTNTNR